jgi:hypothetical protein
MRSKGLGMLAAGLALVGLLVGKYLILEVSLGSGLAAEVQDDPQLMMQAAVFHLEETSSLPKSVEKQLNALSEKDTLPDALWEEMVTAAMFHLESLDDAGREALAVDFTNAMLGGVTTGDRWSASFSGFDLLWIFLAVSTAWSMMTRKHEEPTPVPAEEDDE